MKMFNRLMKQRTLMIISDDVISSVSLRPATQVIALLLILWISGSLLSIALDHNSLASEIESYRSRIAMLDSRNKSLNDTIEDMESVINISLEYLDKIDRPPDSKTTKQHTGSISIKAIADEVAKKRREQVATINNEIEQEQQELAPSGVEPEAKDKNVMLYTKKISDSVARRIKGMESIIDMFHPKTAKKHFGATAAGGMFISEAAANNSQKPLNNELNNSAYYSDLTISTQDIGKQISRLAILNKKVNNLPVGTPLPGSTISSRFGRRSDPFLQTMAIHNGVDMVAPRNSVIRSTGGGRVVYAGRRGSYGITVMVDHGNNIKTLYAHMSKALVSNGQLIRKGDIVGQIGNTGRSTGTHLHYEINIDGRAVNPEKFLYITYNGV